MPTITLSPESLEISGFDFADIPFNMLITAAHRPIQDFISQINDTSDLSLKPFSQNLWQGFPSL